MGVDRHVPTTETELLKQRVERIERTIRLQAAAGRSPTVPLYDPDFPLDAIDGQMSLSKTRPPVIDHNRRPAYYSEGHWHPFDGLSLGSGAFGDVLAGLAGNLVGYWRMGAAAGNQIDTSGFSPQANMAYTSGVVHGTYHATGADRMVADGNDDGAFDFLYNQAIAGPANDAGDSFHADDPKLEIGGTDPWTLMCFAKRHSGWLIPDEGLGLARPQDASILGTRNSAFPEQGMSIDTNPAGDLVAFRGGAGGASRVILPGVLTADTWHHCAATYDGAALAMYLDGVHLGETASAISQAANSALTVGEGRFVYLTAARNRFFYGAVDEVALFNIALTPSEIISLALLEPPSGLVPITDGTGHVTWTRPSITVLIDGA